IEEMHPGEPGACEWGLEDPVAGRLHDLRGSTVGDFERGVRLVWIAVVVLVEPAAEPEAGVEDEGADEGTRPVAGSLEHGGQRRDTVVEAGRPVGVQAMGARRASR